MPPPVDLDPRRFLSAVNSAVKSVWASMGLSPGTFPHPPKQGDISLQNRSTLHQIPESDYIPNLTTASQAPIVVLRDREEDQTTRNKTMDKQGEKSRLKLIDVHYTISRDNTDEGKKNSDLLKEFGRKEGSAA